MTRLSKQAEKIVANSTMSNYPLRFYYVNLEFPCDPIETVTKYVYVSKSGRCFVLHQGKKAKTKSVKWLDEVKVQSFYDDLSEAHRVRKRRLDDIIQHSGTDVKWLIEDCREAYKYYQVTEDLRKMKVGSLDAA